MLWPYITSMTIFIKKKKRWFLAVNIEKGTSSYVDLHNYESELCIVNDRNPTETSVSKREFIA